MRENRTDMVNKKIKYIKRKEDVVMFNKSKKDKEKAMKAQEADMQAKEEKNGAMQEIGDEELGEVSGAGDPFANHPRVPNQKIDSNLRNKG